MHGSLYVNCFYDGGSYFGEEQHELKKWTSSVREYCCGIVEKRKSTSTTTQSDDTFLTGKCLISLITLTSVRPLFFVIAKT